MPTEKFVDLTDYSSDSFDDIIDGPAHAILMRQYLQEIANAEHMLAAAARLSA
jgi:hypothetical protein